MFGSTFPCRNNERQCSEMEGDKVKLDVTYKLKLCKAALKTNHARVLFFDPHPGFICPLSTSVFVLSPMGNASCSAQRPCPSCT